ncbi:hypothetical protein L1987_71084 [Smallanthus sonchifolius]|uniref:Uncharacterized protein n=1 Tax=Smallanthus sonchifolius TaxID=185202 RepID=A0ACB9AST8_9ASTR|nr:hypothetical protein L1987_71084 [Smallanthus sonchifolius]
MLWLSLACSIMGRSIVVGGEGRGFRFSSARGAKNQVNNNKEERTMNQEAGGCSRKRKRRNRRKPETTSTEQGNTKQLPSASTVFKSSPKPSSFLEKMKARLSGGHFRMLNEKLYTCSGDEAFNYFKEDPSLFDMDIKSKCHVGLNNQLTLS